jgi:site-specific recombinase XerD
MSDSEKTSSLSRSTSYNVTIGGTADGGDRVPDLTPREALERWLGKLRSAKADSTVSAYHYQLKHFAAFCEDEGIQSIRAVTGWDIETFETQRREQGLEALSLHKELSTLRLFLEYCARVELVDEELPEKVDPPDVPRDAHVDETRLHTDDARTLLAYYDEHDYGTRTHALLTLTWFTGCRLGGVRSLDVTDYYPDDQYIHFQHRPDRGTPLKNGRDGERAVGLADYAVDVLDEYLATERKDKYDDEGNKPLITSSVGRASENAVRAWMYLATQPCLHSPCPHGKERSSCEWVDYTYGSKCASSRSPHQVRTGSITWQLNRGVPVEAVSQRVNTSVRVLKRHYDQPTHLEELEERRREHVDRLGFGERDPGGGDA